MFVKSLGSIHQVDASGATVLDENGQPLLEPSGGFLQIAGAKVYYDTTLDADARILDIKVYDPSTQTYLPLDKTKTYYLATNDFLAAGGDGYTMLGGAREEGGTMDSVFASYLEKADLTQYAVINPNSRSISISTSDYQKLVANPNSTDTTASSSPTDDTTTNILDILNSSVIAGHDKSVEKTPFVEKVKASVNGKDRVLTPTSYTDKKAFAESLATSDITDSSGNVLPNTASSHQELLVLLGFSLVTAGVYGKAHYKYNFKK